MLQILEPLKVPAGQAGLIFFWDLLYKNQSLIHIILWFIFFSVKLSTLFFPVNGNLCLIHCGALSAQKAFWSITDYVLVHDELLNFKML